MNIKFQAQKVLGYTLLFFVLIADRLYTLACRIMRRDEY
jgi:hypothetical protein